MKRFRLLFFLRAVTQRATQCGNRGLTARSHRAGNPSFPPNLEGRAAGRFLWGILFGLLLVSLSTAQPLDRPFRVLPPSATSPSNYTARVIDMEDRPVETNVFDILNIPLPPELIRTKARALETQSETAAAEYLAVGEHEKALTAYDAMSSTPLAQRPPNRLGRALALFHTGKEIEAEQLLAGLVREFPDEPVYQNNLAWLYATAKSIQLRSSRKALHHARKAMLHAPREPRIWNTLAEAYYLARDYEKAVQISQQAVELARRDGRSDEFLPDLEANLERFEAAIKVISVLRE